MKRILLYVLIAIISFIGFTLILAPASTIWSFFSQDVLARTPGLNVYQVQGTAWHGHGNLQYLQFPQSELSWQVEPLTLLTGKVSTDLRLQGEAHEFNGHLNLDQTSLEVPLLTGYLDAAYINQVSQPQGVTFSGRIEVQSLKISSDLVWFEQAEGKIYWPGGKIISRTVAAGTRVFDLPALQGDISMDNKVISLDIHHAGATLVDIQLKPDGWVVVAVKARLFDIAQLPWPAGSSLDDTVIQFEEKLF